MLVHFINFNMVPLILIIFILISLILVLFSQNPIYSVLFLMLSFSNSALLLLYIGVDFLAILLLVIYVGAISILFLFVIMMIDIKFNLLSQKKAKSSWANLIIIILILSFFFLNLVLFFKLDFFNLETFYYLLWSKLIYLNYDVQILGFVLFNFFFYQFVLIGLILFIAMVGCISLVLESNLISKKQDLFQQILSSNNKNLFLTSLKKTTVYTDGANNSFKNFQ